MKRHIIKTNEKTKNMKRSNKFVKRYGSLEYDNLSMLQFKLISNNEISNRIHKEIEKILNKEGYELLDTYRLNRSQCHKKVKK